MKLSINESGRRNFLPELVPADPQHQELKNYLAAHIIGDEPFTTSTVPRYIVRGGFLVLGGLFFIPWIGAATQAANVFPEDSAARNAFSYIFPIGASIATAVDQIWVMKKAGDEFAIDAPTVAVLYPKNHKHYSRYVLPFIFSLAAELPWTYAAIKFNPSLAIGIPSAILVAANNMGFSWVGYKRLQDKVIQTVQSYRTRNSEVEVLRASLLANIAYHLQTGELLAAGGDATQLLQRLSLMSLNTTNSRSKAYLLLRGAFVTAVPAVYGTATFLLTRRFLLENVWQKDEFAISASIMLTLPSFVMSVLAGDRIYEKSQSLISRKDDANSIMSRLYPKTRYAAYALVGLFALIAPASEAVIISQTTKKEIDNTATTWLFSVGGFLFISMFFVMSATDLLKFLMLQMAIRAGKESSPGTSVSTRPTERDVLLPTIRQVGHSDRLNTSMFYASNKEMNAEMAKQHIKLAHALDVVSIMDGKKLR